MTGADDAEGADWGARAAAFFGPTGPLGTAGEVGGRPYEERPQQAQMARHVAHCLGSGRHACIEAPTGVGKSLAYLVPAIFFAQRQGLPVVVTTHTIALQEQLLAKDLPLLQRLLETPFAAVMAKGRENYVCRRRLANAVERSGRFGSVLTSELKHIVEWTRTTSDGSLSDLTINPSGQTWAAVCSESGTCAPGAAACAGQECFYRRARQRLFRADIIVANHALFATDLELRRTSPDHVGILPDYGAAIIDEAQTFEEAAASHLGLRLNSDGIVLLLQRLYDRQTGRGLLAGAGDDATRAAVAAATDAAVGFFARLRRWIAEQYVMPLPYTVPGHIPNLLSNSWTTMDTALRRLLRTEAVDDVLRAEVRQVQARLARYGSDLDAFLSMRLPDSVYWFELTGHNRRRVVFSAVPVMIGDVLNRLLFSAGPPVILTSATLAVKNDLGYFLGRIGASAAETLVLDSPFDFREQVDLYVPYDDMPLPADGDEYVPALCDQIRHFIIESGGKAFVLFTNHQVMNKAADRLEPFFQESKIRLMVHGRELPRAQMLDLFRREVNSVIFGADSFWMGVDVPGAALSNVIIVKLPFPVPSHPLVAAKKAWIEAGGGNAFRDYFLPEAILKFRQAIGRLVRRRDDRGMIVVLDPRILHTRYGCAFLESMPDCRRHLF